MLSVPSLAPSLELIGDGGAPVRVSPELAPAAPETPASRLGLAVALAVETALPAFQVAQRQRGIDPVIVIACADSTVGRTLIDKRFGAGVAEALCGPMAFALAETELVQLIGPAAAAGLARAYQTLKRAPAELRFLLAVNGVALDARVLREVAEPARPPDAQGPEAAPAPSAPAPVAPEAPEASVEPPAVEPAAAQVPEPDPAITTG